MRDDQANTLHGENDHHARFEVINLKIATDESG